MTLIMGVMSGFVPRAFGYGSAAASCSAFMSTTIASPSISPHVAITTIGAMMPIFPFLSAAAVTQYPVATIVPRSSRMFQSAVVIPCVL